MAGNPKHVVLAYSGGLDTSVAIPWIKEHYGAAVTTLTIDVGQEGELTDAIERAPLNGAKDALLVDAKETFAEEFLFPALKANCLYQGVYPLSTSLARPLIVRHLVSAALRLGADAVAHGCTGKGNDQVRFDVGVHTLAPHLGIIAPVREWNMNRQDEMAYAKQHGLKIHQKPDSPYSVDENLWGRSIEGGRLEDAGTSPPEEVFQWTGHPDSWPKEPEELTLSFEKGTPIAVNGRKLPAVALIQEVGRIAGRHGVGRIDHVEDRVVGIKSRETYECPAAIPLVQAHQALESLVLPRDLLSFKAGVDRRYADAVYEGMWYSPLTEALTSFVESTQETVTGAVTVRLLQGTSRVVARSSPFSLLSKELATYDRGSTFRQEAAEGFIHLFGLANRLAYAKRREALSGGDDKGEGGRASAAGAVSPPTPP
jgi:argininosuccinate synthase